jgi:hypothetical protein
MVEDIAMTPTSEFCNRYHMKLMGRYREARVAKEKTITLPTDLVFFIANTLVDAQVQLEECEAKNTHNKAGGQ